MITKVYKNGNKIYQNIPLRGIPKCRKNKLIGDKKSGNPDADSDFFLFALSYLFTPVGQSTRSQFVADLLSLEKSASRVQLMPAGKSVLKQTLSLFCQLRPRSFRVQ
jgi:hypothetical protein